MVGPGDQGRIGDVQSHLDGCRERGVGVRVRCRVTSSGTQRQSSRSSAKSYGATTPMPVCSSGGTGAGKG